MRRLYPLLTLAIVLSPTASGISQAHPADSSVVQQIRDLRDRWIAAEERKDIPYLQKLLANDCVIGNSQGQVLNKQQFLVRMASPDRVLAIRNTRNVKVRLFGDTAILTEEITIDGRDHGEPFGGNFRFVRVFHQYDGHWKVILGQGTPIRSSP
jgi:ketosteroid isomerase-like protein